MREEHEHIDRSHWATPKKSQSDRHERLNTSVSGIPATPLQPDASADTASSASSDAPSTEDLMSSPMLGPSTTPITLPITLEEEARLKAAGKPVPKNLFGFLNKVDPRVVALLGSIAVGMNPVFVRLAGENAATAVFFRFAIALIPLGIFALLELRLNGRMRAKDVLLHLLAGVFFGLDVGLWIPGVLLAGAGIATVAGNLQVIIVPLLALLIFREKLSKPFLIAIPVMLGGVVLLSGVIEHGIGGDAFLGVLLAVAGGIAYAGYIMIIGRARPTGHASTNVFLSSFSSMIVGTAVASGWGAPNFTPDLQPLILLILMALFSQVIGWVATASALPRLDASTGSMLLLTQPLVAILGGVLLIGEQISVLQWVGIAAIIAAVWFTSFMSGRMRRKRPGAARK
ncbi:DMT family transporter [Gulosibacter chungangensis]|uniref:DMT family transporter n=1 Tax=Gulosibacter chungangensis TaxID=979746 RepID=A0A7J5B9H2_9MICO|nr:DMT family transporter [Gulosibacter chungangensis]KAB1642220.1 DMT family transporter [Gulosibacter chungangensis]